MSSEKNYLTIGQLVSKLKKIYPDLSSSKLRFLESKGLISPGRADNKYRVYSKEDIRKINFILKMQKEYYMPLDIIKEKLSAVDFNLQNDDQQAIKDIQLKLGENLDEMSPEFLTIQEAADRHKVNISFINELIEGDIIQTVERSGQEVIRDRDIEIIKLAVELGKYGIRVKHLKMFDNFATRHASFMQQIVLPMILSSNKASHKNGVKILSQIESNLENLHMLLVKKKNNAFLEQHK
jgi:DNA-binding transcriptional MerR regulator